MEIFKQIKLSTEESEQALGGLKYVSGLTDQDNIKLIDVIKSAKRYNTNVEEMDIVNINTAINAFKIMKKYDAS